MGTEIDPAENETQPGGSGHLPLSWLPTMDGGGLLRASVRSFAVTRVDGEFQDGSKSSWTVQVNTTWSDEPVTLRPIFLNAADLCEFVDAVFPGAVYRLLPPDVVTESPDWKLQADQRNFGPTARQAAAAIKYIIETALSGDAYTPEWRNTGQGSGHIS